jgi:lysophospholipase L1-like esterase
MNVISIKKFIFYLLYLVLLVLIVEGFIRGGYVIYKSKFIKSQNSGFKGERDYWDGANQDGKYEPWAMMEYSPYLAFVPKRNYSGRGYYTNQYHMRYKESFPVKKEKNEVRIFVLGNSTAWGADVNQEQLHTTLLEELLNKKFIDKKIRVICAGVNGYVSTQERIFFENFILSLSPDWVILFSGFNDAHAGYLGMSVMERTADFMGLRKRLKGAMKNMTIEESEIRDSLSLPLYSDYSFKFWFLVDTLAYRLKYQDPKTLENLIVKRRLNEDEVVNNLLHNVKIINSLSKRHHSGLIYYLQPYIFTTTKQKSEYEIHMETKLENQSLAFSGYLSEIYSLYRKRIHQNAIEEGYLFYDADNAIKDETRSVITEGGHMADRGYRLIAENLYDLLIPLLEKS